MTHPSTDLTRASTTTTPERALAPDPREARRALRAAEALGHRPEFSDVVRVTAELGRIPRGGSAIVCGLTVERLDDEDRVRYRITSPWCGRELSGRFGHSGPVVRRALREQLLRGWLADE
jgi:hypothetical protein